MPDEIQEHDEAVIERCIDELRKRFDTVEIFVTRQEHGGKDSDTVGFATGCGNWYARYGQIAEWLDTQKCGK